MKKLAFSLRSKAIRVKFAHQKKKLTKILNILPYER